VLPDERLPPPLDDGAGGGLELRDGAGDDDGGE
jgi:hypothetical protein